MPAACARCVRSARHVAARASLLHRQARPGSLMRRAKLLSLPMLRQQQRWNGPKPRATRGAGVEGASAALAAARRCLHARHDKAAGAPSFVEISARRDLRVPRSTNIGRTGKRRCEESGPVISTAPGGGWGFWLSMRTGECISRAAPTWARPTWWPTNPTPLCAWPGRGDGKRSTLHLRLALPRSSVETRVDPPRV